MQARVTGNTVHLAGEADSLESAQVLEEALAGVLAAGHREVTVNAAGLEFADAASVRVLVRAARALYARHGTLRLTEASPIVARILELTGADQAIEVTRAEPPAA